MTFRPPNPLDFVTVSTPAATTSYAETGLIAHEAGWIVLRATDARIRFRRRRTADSGTNLDSYRELPPGMTGWFKVQPGDAIAYKVLRVLSGQVVDPETGIISSGTAAPAFTVSWTDRDPSGDGDFRASGKQPILIHCETSVTMSATTKYVQIPVPVEGVYLVTRNIWVRSSGANAATGVVYVFQGQQNALTSTRIARQTNSAQGGSGGAIMDGLISAYQSPCYVASEGGWITVALTVSVQGDVYLNTFDALYVGQVASVTGTVA